MRKVYLDNAATTPMDPEVVSEMIPMMQNHFGNPSSTHAFGREVKSKLELSRRRIAKILNAEASEIIFTSGGTEADNMALKCAVHDLGVTRIITSKIEHHAVLHTAEELEASNVKLEFVKLDDLGHVDMDHLEGMLESNSEKTIVSLMHANNEIGTMIDLVACCELVHKYGGYFHSDTVQTMGHYKFDVKELKVDFLTCSAHKLHGPKGIGFLYAKEGLNLQPLIQGGSQERNRRAGTENIYGIVGLAKALELADHEVEEHQTHVQALKSYMIERLEKELPGVEFNGDAKGKSLYTVLSVLLPESSKADILLFSLDLQGIACSGGSACSSGSNKGSHVIEGIGKETQRPVARFSFSRFTSKDDIDYTVDKIKEIYEI